MTDGAKNPVIIGEKQFLQIYDIGAYFKVNFH